MKMHYILNHKNGYEDLYSTNFVARMRAMTLSQHHGDIDILNGETGEVLSIYRMGYSVWEAENE